MSHFSRVELSEAFCSYCGRSAQKGRHHASRVCMRCKLGMVLHAPFGEAPRRDPFLIVDDELIVQAISHRAELVLGIEEPDRVHALFDEFLQPVNGSLDAVDLAPLLKLAVAGRPSPSRLELRAVDEPRQRFRVRVTSCGQPPAALVVLNPLTDRAEYLARIGPARGPTATATL